MTRLQAMKTDELANRPSHIVTRAIKKYNTSIAIMIATIANQWPSSIGSACPYILFDTKNNINAFSLLIIVVLKHQDNNIIQKY